MLNRFTEYDHIVRLQNNSMHVGFKCLTLAALGFMSYLDLALYAMFVVRLIDFTLPSVTLL